MDDLDDLEEQMHEILDALELEPELVEMMRALWLCQINMERQARRMH